MPYECSEPVNHDGTDFIVGDKIPDDALSKRQAKRHIKSGVLNKLDRELSDEEMEAFEKKVAVTMAMPMDEREYEAAREAGGEAYECIEPLDHDGRHFVEGDKIPKSLISGAQATHLMETGVLKPIAKISKKEEKAAMDKEQHLAKTPDLQVLKAEDALNMINGEEHLANLERWTIQEQEGRNRKTLLNAIERRSKILVAT